MTVTTNEEMLAAWDAGKPVWTCDMGGMGPGYEQAIHMMAMEFLRAMLADPMDYEALGALETDDERREATREYSNRIEAVLAARAMVDRIGPSGAQFGAAMNIAHVFASKGHAGAQEAMPEDRKILVSKHFPADAS